MNPTAAVMLVQDSVRPVKVEYDPDNSYNNKGAQHTHFFKCLDPDIKKGDLVIVTTQTRHGMTVAKVAAIGAADVTVNFDGSEHWGWVVGPVPAEQHKRILEVEQQIVGRVQVADLNDRKAKLKAAMGLANVSFSDLDLSAVGLPAPMPPEAPATEAPPVQSAEEYHR